VLQICARPPSGATSLAVMKLLGRSLAEAIIPLCTWGAENAAQMANISLNATLCSSRTRPTLLLVGIMAHVIDKY
jgi:hypothetical protein